MKDLLKHALDVAQVNGATYADIRIVDHEIQTINVKNGAVGALRHRTDYGFGVRVIANGAWGFASSDEMTKAEIERVAALAVKIAKASALAGGRNVVLSPLDPVEDVWANPYDIDPFSVSLEDKIELMLKADAEMRTVKGVTITESSMVCRRYHQFFASTEGSLIEQTITITGAGIICTAIQDGTVQVRSFPSSFRGQYQTRGYELVHELDLVGRAGKCAEEAVALLSAKPCPEGVMDIVLEGSQLALQIHESCGHAIELDRVLGYEANFAGTSFLTPDKQGRLKYGSDIVNLVADATAPNGLGTFGYDDEGVPAQNIPVVKDGLFVDYMTSRETAPLIGQRSNGTMRANGWNNIPLIRMTNVSLLPGDSNLEEMIAGIDHGVYFSTNRSWSIDDKRWDFQFGTEIGWEIKNGKLGDMVKNPVYADNTVHFWNSCDAIGNASEWTLWGTPNCGKGEPSQVINTGHGAAPARFRNINVRRGA
ncbi:MAG: TldD/PmbA family protein [Gemmatimonadetes bacterium]|nr:MAG: TldD/PmbA family protein [Gemmatimonadota bacterium]